MSDLCVLEGIDGGIVIFLSCGLGMVEGKGYIRWKEESMSTVSKVELVK